MASKRNSWIYITLLLLCVFALFLLIFVSLQDRLRLSLPVYFFLLVICDLGATAFLAGALKSSAEWTGNVMKGNLKLTGPAVIFVLILLIGYRFRPVSKEDPFDFTVILFDPAGGNRGFSGDSLQIILDNDIRNSAVSGDGKAVFYNVDSRYLGKTVHITARREGFKISRQPDTTVLIPNSSLPVVRLALLAAEDSSVFSGFLLKRNPGKHPAPVPDAVITFSDYSKTVSTDSVGRFILYLRAKAGENTDITIFRKQKMIFSGKVTLSRSMQILADE